MSEALAIFAKAPVPGFAKTRLTPPLTPAEAAQVYEASLEAVVAAALGSGVEVTIFFDPAHEGEAYFASAYPAIRRLPQEGEGLGDRLANAFDTLFSHGFQRVSIIGADSPTLPAAYLAEAFATLRGTDVVLGPTLDGGYYLVGLNRRAWPRARTRWRRCRTSGTSPTSCWSAIPAIAARVAVSAPARTIGNAPAARSGAR